MIERLDNVSYIVHCVLLPDINAASPRRKHDGLAKSCAYAYGPVAVDVLCYPFQRQEDRPDTPDKLLASLQAELKATLTVKAALVAKLLETKGINATEILKVQHKQVDVEQTQAPLEEYEKLKAHLKAFIESMPFERRKSRPDDPPDNIIKQIEASGVGLRANEILHLGVGVLPDSVKVAYESAKYPEWVNRDGETEHDKH